MDKRPVLLRDLGNHTKPVDINVASLLRTVEPVCRMLPPFPADMAKRDFRLTSDLLEAVKQAYPQGQVPDTLLGVR